MNKKIMKSKEKAEKLINTFIDYDPDINKKLAIYYAYIVSYEVCNTLDVFNIKYTFWCNVRNNIILKHIEENNKGTQ